MNQLIGKPESKLFMGMAMSSVRTAGSKSGKLSPSEWWRRSRKEDLTFEPVNEILWNLVWLPLKWNVLNGTFTWHGTIY